MKLSQKVQAMQFSPIRKFNVYAIEAKEKGKKVYHLNIGQPDIKTPKAFMEAVKNFDSHVLAYAESGGLVQLQDAIANYFKRFGMDIERKDVLITNGGSEALSMIYTCLLDYGDEVLIPEPFYTNYQTFISAAGGKVVPVTTKAEEGYRYAYADRIEKVITDKTRAISLVNPGNPTGTILTRDEMRVIADVAKKHDLWIIADEVYREFAYDGREMTSFGQLEDIKERVIIVDSVSKRFSACGARIGCIVSKNQELMSNAMKLAQGRLCCPTLDMIGATALYELDPSYFNEVRTEYEARRDAVYEEIMKIPGVVCQKPGGAFYIMVKLPVESSEDFLVWLLTEFDDGGETVMYAPIQGFYGTEGLGRDELRIAYVLKKEDLVRGVELMRLGLEKYKELGYK
ncbi:pyridoxal phosphate-dependent aminotransferase [Aminipila luticellarii]|uniref:Aminotransferase n=1 Tax=Aminipila luticellarii TaxID=2507160 RepID=A0A410PVB6_9FIRM|nr:pyridoxal phosphate-dependent aminotransferase [Aminipila luticellarii]QAT42848.1 pyridoxal phosphate-dependent aminotransferase [Aminipila luticellarii]